MNTSGLPPRKMQKLQDAEQGSSGDGGMSILELNDDCLFHIFSFFKLRQLIIVENVCKRFMDIAQMIYRNCRVLNIAHIYAFTFTHKDATEIIRRVGRNIHTLNIKFTCIIPPYLIGEKTVPLILEVVHQTCKNLRSIELTQFNDNDQKSIEALADICKEVKVAKFGCHTLTDDQLMSVLKLNQLEELDLTYCEIEGKFLSSLTNIRKLSLRCATHLNPKLFVQFCEEHPNLQSLNISYFELITEDCLKSIETNLTKLQEITIDSQFLKLQNYFILANLPEIRKLTLKYLSTDVNIVNDLLLKFSLHDQLEYLEIESFNENPDTEKILAKFTKLKELNFPLVKFCSDSTLDCLSCTTTLQRLHLRSTHITSFGLVRLITRCPNIKYIDVTGCLQFDANCIFGILVGLEGRSHVMELRIDIELTPYLKPLRESVGQKISRMKLTNDLWYDYCES